MHRSRKDFLLTAYDARYAVPVGHTDSHFGQHQPALQAFLPGRWNGKVAAGQTEIARFFFGAQPCRGKPTPHHTAKDPEQGEQTERCEPESDDGHDHAYYPRRAAVLSLDRDFSSVAVVLCVHLRQANRF